MLNSAPAVIAFEVSDTGIGIPAGEAEADLRGVPAGRRRHQPQIWRHRPRPCHQPRAREPARRRNPPEERARQGLDLHALSAAEIFRPDGGAARQRRRRRNTPPSLRCRPRRRSASIEQLPDDRLNLEPGDTILLIVEDDPHYARVLIDLARDKGFKVLVAARGTEALELAKQYPAGGGLARRVPAGHARLDRAEPAQAQSADAAYPGADHHAGRGPPACAGARRVLLRQQADDDRRRRRGAVADQGIRQAAPQAAADRGGQCRRADEHPRTARSRRYRDRRHRHRRRRAHDLARKPLRLRRARSAPARHERVRSAGPHPQRRRAVQCSRRRLHGPGTFRRGRRGTAHHGAQHRGQGRGIAGTPARRNLAVPASRDHGTADREAAHAGAAQQFRRGSGRKDRASGRRRRPQHLRALQRAGTARHEGVDCDDRARGRSRWSNPTRKYPSC